MTSRIPLALGAVLVASVAAPVLAQGDTNASGPTLTAQESGCPTGKIYCFDQEQVNATAGGTVTFVNPSTNTMHHSLCIDVTGGPLCTPNSTTGSPPGSTVPLQLPANVTGTFAFYCNVDAHRELGMEGNITIAAPANATGNATGNLTGGGTSTTSNATPGFGAPALLVAAGVVGLAAWRRR